MQLTEKQKYEIIVLREENYKINEIAWAKKNINRDWDKVIFSDECSLRINGLTKKQWIHKNDTIIKRTNKYSLKKTFGDVFSRYYWSNSYIF